MAHLLLVERMKESVRSEQMVSAQTGRPAPDLDEALTNLDLLINNDESMLPTETAEQQAEREQLAALRSSLGLPATRG